MSTWKPKRTLAEVDAILTAPGAVLELEDVVIDGVKYRAYKNLPKSIREEWLNTAVFGPREYLVFHQERYTYAQSHIRVNELANLFYTEYGLRKGDHVAILARNSPEFVFAFWTLQVLGCVSVLVNAWIIPDVMEHCVTFTDCKVVILDVERAGILRNSIEKLKKGGTQAILVVRSNEGKGKIPAGMIRLEEGLDAFRGAKTVPFVDVGPEDTATILFTSGTTGLPKGVVGTQRQFLTNSFNSILPVMRATLRNGDDLPPPDPAAPQKGTLLSTPLFHVTGLHSVLQTSTMMGNKIVLMYKWDPVEAVDLVIKEKLNSAGGIPFMASGLISDGKLNAANSQLETIGWGGGPSSKTLPLDLVKQLGNRNAPGQGYGSTETSSLAVTFNGEDFLARPTSTGLPCLTIDVKVCDPDGKTLPTCEGPDGDGIGEIYFRGVNRTNGYWKDPKATSEAFLPDGWFKTGDIGYIDHEGFVYVLDRVKDVIIRAGENIASAVVEDALYLDGRLEDVAVFALKDDIFGEVVGAAVTTKAYHHNTVTEDSLLQLVANLLPKHCVPVIVDIRDTILPRNGTGKTLKKELRKEVQEIWETRKKGRSKL